MSASTPNNDGPGPDRAGARADLNPQRSLSDYEAQLRRAAVEISLSAERERRAIAGDVHDNIGQGLALAKMRLSHLCAQADGDLLAELTAVHANIADSLQACRLLANDLATPALYKLGLVAALKSLIAETVGKHDLNVTANFGPDDTDLPPTTRVILYRVIRELLLNVIKHAGARNVSIDVGLDADTIKIVVHDDGTGFDASEKLGTMGPECGLGLFLVRERLWHLGGSFDIHSETDKGTTVTLSAPVRTTFREQE